MTWVGRAFDFIAGDTIAGRTPTRKRWQAQRAATAACVFCRACSSRRGGPQLVFDEWNQPGKEKRPQLILAPLGAGVGKKAVQ